MSFRFGEFTLDGAARQLRRGDEALRLSPKAFDLLGLLLQRRPEAVSKTEIHECLWRDTFVADINIAVLVTEIREALGEDARHPQWIRTVHRFGYAFSGSASETGRDGTPATIAASCWVMWGRERAPLRPGDNLLGRDPESDVRIDAVGVSRRHARIVVADGLVTLHDLSSKNGTYIDDVRITSPVQLTDGTEVRLGPALLCFRQLPIVTSTQTVNSARRTRSRR